MTLYSSNADNVSIPGNASNSGNTGNSSDVGNSGNLGNNGNKFCCQYTQAQMIKRE